MVPLVIEFVWEGRFFAVQLAIVHPMRHSSAVRRRLLHGLTCYSLVYVTSSPRHLVTSSLESVYQSRHHQIAKWGNYRRLRRARRLPRLYRWSPSKILSIYILNMNLPYRPFDTLGLDPTSVGRPAAVTSCHICTCCSPAIVPLYKVEPLPFAFHYLSKYSLQSDSLYSLTPSVCNLFYQASTYPALLIT